MYLDFPLKTRKLSERLIKNRLLGFLLVLPEKNHEGIFSLGGIAGDDHENEEDLPDFKELYAQNFKKVYNKVKASSYYPSY